MRLLLDTHVFIWWDQGARLSPKAAAESGFEELPVRIAHAEAVEGLSWLHRDPFDCLLVAQALAERLTVVTRNVAFWQYGVKVLKV